MSDLPTSPAIQRVLDVLTVQEAPIYQQGRHDQHAADWASLAARCPEEIREPVHALVAAVPDIEERREAEDRAKRILARIAAREQQVRVEALEEAAQYVETESAEVALFNDPRVGPAYLESLARCVRALSAAPGVAAPTTQGGEG